MDTTSRHPPSIQVDRQAAAFARRFVSEKYAASDAALREKWKDTLASIHDVTGARQSPEWLEAEIARVVETRVYSWDMQRVPEPVAVRRRPIMSKRNSGGRTKVWGAAYRSIQFGIGPINSCALFLAAEAGYSYLAGNFLHSFGATLVSRFQFATKAHVIAATIHPGLWTTHATCLWSPWSEPMAAMPAKPGCTACMPVGKRRFRSFSPKLSGVLHQAALGIDTDRLIGRSGSVSQAMWYLHDARRCQTPLNYLMERWARLWVHGQIGREPRWQLLRPFFAIAAVTYRARKAEQLAVMGNMAQRRA